MISTLKVLFFLIRSHEILDVLQLSFIWLKYGIYLHEILDIYFLPQSKNVITRLLFHIIIYKINYIFYIQICLHAN
jgi:hypothetical protein